MKVIHRKREEEEAGGGNEIRRVDQRR